MTRAIVFAILSAAALIDGAAAVTGRVVADDTGEAIINARVRVTLATGSSRLAITDTEGRFSVAAPGTALRIAAIKSGYVRREIDIRAGTEAIELRLTRAAVVAGRVVDRTGDPVARGLVVAEAPPASRTGGRTLARAQTDDRGQFRIAGLAPEPVVVAVLTLGLVEQAEVLPNGVTMYRPRQTKTYFPRGESADEADVITLAPGEEREGIDFVVGVDQTGFGDVRFSGRVTQTAGPVAGATGTIRGRVRSTEGRALAGAQVQLLGSPAPIALRGMRADADGRFEFANVPAGSFRVAATKAGYEPARAADAVLPAFPSVGAGPVVDVHDGDTISRVEIELRRMGTLSGLVLDDLGEPVQGATVELMKVRYERGRRRLAGAASGVSDDRGAYRMFAIPSGQYIVTASVGGVATADLPGYARTYYPGTIDPRSAQFVSVAPSQEVVGVDISLLPGRTARIAGTILGSAGQPTMAGTLQLRPNAAAGEIAALPVGAKINPDGTFEFPNVPLGAYLIYADKGRPQPSVEGDFSVTPVSVTGDDVTGLTIQMPPGSTIAGRVTFDTADRNHLPPFGSIQISPVPVDPDLAPASLADPDILADGRFVMRGVTGTRRLLPTRLPAGWTLREVRVNGVDATDRPLTFGKREQSLSDVEFVLTDRVGEIRGSAVDADGRVVPGAFVVAMPMDRERRYGGSRFLRRATPDADGAFRIASLPAGAYYVAAVRATPVDGEDAWQDPSFLESLAPVTTSVTVYEGEAQTLALHVPAR